MNIRTSEPSNKIKKKNQLKPASPKKPNQNKKKTKKFTKTSNLGTYILDLSYMNEMDAETWRIVSVTLYVTFYSVSGTSTPFSNKMLSLALFAPGCHA